MTPEQIKHQLMLLVWQGVFSKEDLAEAIMRLPYRQVIRVLNPQKQLARRRATARVSA
jgi:hypothetical protein